MTPMVEESAPSCLECGETSTPQWRRGPLGPNTLCNRCGVRYARREAGSRAARVERAERAHAEALAQCGPRGGRKAAVLDKEAPAVLEPAVLEPAVLEPAVLEPAVLEPAVLEPEHWFECCLCGDACRGDGHDPSPLDCSPQRCCAGCHAEKVTTVRRGLVCWAA